MNPLSLQNITRLFDPDESIPIPAVDRNRLAHTIAQYLYSAHLREEGLPLKPIGEAAVAEAMPYLRAARFVVGMTLSPDRFQAAVMAMADIFCDDGSNGSLSIFQASRRTQTHYYQLAVSALHALQVNCFDTPPDAKYRDELSRLADALEQEVIERQRVIETLPDAWKGFVK